MGRGWILTGAILAALAVALGAFGAHGLEAVLTANEREATFITANRYHIAHALAILLAVALSAHLTPRGLRWANILFVVGVILFSGSLYVLAVFNLGIMGAVAPLGGTAFILGWLVLGWDAWRKAA